MLSSWLRPSCFRFVSILLIFRLPDKLLSKVHNQSLRQQVVNDYTIKQSLLFRVSDVIIAAGEQRGNSNAMQTINACLIYKFGFFA